MDRRRRIGVLAVALLVLLAALGVQAALAGSNATRSTDAVYSGGTLITVQSYGWFDRNNGNAFVVNETGEVVWEFDPPDTRVFDAEWLSNGNVQVAMATHLPEGECPPVHGGSDGCVLNRIVEVDRETREIVWNYSWTDVFMTAHEVHDADRLPSGKTAIVDMGNDRAFVVDQNGTITWEWRAENHLSEGTEFWERYVPESNADEYRRPHSEADWTHMNDIDRLPNGNFQLSIRNFDVVIEVDRETKAIVDVIGRPGNHAIMNEQHNPNRLANGTLLVSDSENDRIVELDAETGEPIWSYTGETQNLAWPRDADRLPNGNTLIVDSRNFRVLEINATGEVVWRYSLEEERGIVYDADRLGLPEEPDDVPSAYSFGTDGDLGVGSSVVTDIESWAGFVFPAWVEFPELLTIAAATLVTLALVVDAGLYLVTGRRRVDPSVERGD